MIELSRRQIGNRHHEQRDRDDSDRDRWGERRRAFVRRAPSTVSRRHQFPKA
jgi:hypothetical protein